MTQAKPTPFHEQLEALLVIPSSQGSGPPLMHAHATGRTKEEPSAELDPAAAAPPVVMIEVPTFLHPAAFAETGLALDLPVPRDALPFVDPGNAIGGTSLVGLPPPVPREPSFTGTVEATVLPVPGRVLPFEQRAEELAATAVLGALPVPGRALPFPSANEPVLEGLSLQDYAALCAALASRPKDAERIFAEHGLTDAAKRRTTDETWRAYLKGHPEAYARWQDLYRKHVSGVR